MNKKETFGKDSMLRQISESVMISRIEKTRLINNKREWNIPRIATVNISDTIQKGTPDKRNKDNAMNSET